MKIITSLVAVYILWRLLKFYKLKRLRDNLKPGQEVTVKIGNEKVDAVIREKRTSTFYAVETEKNYYLISKKQIWH